MFIINPFSGPCIRCIQLDPTSQTQFDNPNDSNMEEMPIVLTRVSLKLSCTLIQTLAINTRLSLVGRLKLQKGNLSNQNKEAVQVELTDKWYPNMPFLDVPLLKQLAAEGIVCRTEA